MMTDSEETIDLDSAVTTAIDHWLQKFPPERRQSALLASLHVAQDHYQGYLTVPVMNAVADYLEVPRVAAYEAATFYSLYTTIPAGRHKIDVCTNISCMLRGSTEVVEHLEQRLDVKLGGVTADDRFRLRAVECLGACINAPMMQVDKDYHENLTSDKIDEILTHYE